MDCYGINIAFDFPNGDKTQPPTVTTPTTRIDTVGSAYGGIAWSVSANITDMDGLYIVDVLFFTDSAKRNRVDPPCLDAGTWDPVALTYTMWFNESGVADLTTYYYDVQFRDDSMSAAGDWDPTLKIQPRSAENPPREQEAGA